MSEIVVDVGARLVRHDGRDIHLAPKAFDLLVMLINNRPNAVSHDDLHAALWPGVHVSETSLAALITQLRKALDDSSGEERVIRTLHRVGYAFTGEAVIAGRAATPSSLCRLIWRGESIELLPGASVIGRDHSCAVHMDADSVSRQHARLSVDGTQVFIEDLGSKNGTWVEGERIHGSVTLTDGATLRVGSETVRVEIGLDARSTRTVLSS